MLESQEPKKYHSAKSVDRECRRCNSHDVVTSRHRGIEGWIVSVLPLNVYRCVECYNRFWSVESLFASSKRAWFWGGMAFVALLLFIFILNAQLSNSSPNLNRTTEFISPFDTETQSQQESKLSEPVASAVLTDSGVATDVSDSAIDLASDGLIDESIAISEVKAQAEQLLKNSQESVAHLDQKSSDDEKALELSLKVDMNSRVERWRDAWQSGLVDYYLAFYSQNFTPSKKITYQAWVKQRRYLVSPEKQIKIEISNFNVSFSNDLKESTVLFDQHYNSKTYSEVSRKKMVWTKERDEWKIVSESQVTP